MAKHSDTTTEERADRHRSTLAVPRSRGLLSGLALLALGIWGALLPFVGPIFHFGYGPDQSWHWTAARFWLQLLPGVVTALAGLFILLGGNRVTGTIWAYLAAAAGAWFIVGPILADLHRAGYVGGALGGNTRQHYEAIAAFYGLGGAILFFSALIAGRLSVVGIRDLETAERRRSDKEPQVVEVPAVAQPVTAQPLEAQPVAAQPVVARPVTAPAETVRTEPVRTERISPATRPAAVTTTRVRPGTEEETVVKGRHAADREGFPEGYVDGREDSNQVRTDRTDSTGGGTPGAVRDGSGA